MVESNVQRRLAAILAADVVGYSRLMEQDEVDTFERLRRHRKELFEPEIEKHHGRIFKLMGDGLLAEFGSVVDALECAVVLQRAMAERNAGLAAGGRIDSRIGINLGDVIVEDEDRHGDGVNIADRLQGLAEPGGIAISGTAYDQVKTKVAVGYAFLGEQAVKNIAEPVRVYRVLLDPAAAGSTVLTKRKMASPRRWPAIAGASAVALAAIAAGVALALWPRETPCLTSALQPLTAGPSIAVLPLDNLSGDPAQGPIVDGIADDLTTALTQVRDLFVIARNSSFAYRGKACDMRRVASELGVRNLIEGSVQREGDRMRINIQLIDGSSGGHVWADAFDGSFSDHLALQDKMTRRIADALSLRVSPGAAETAARGETQVPAAYEAFLRGWEHYRRYTFDDFKKAVPDFEEAISLDQNYGRAYAALAMIYVRSATRGWSKVLGISENEAVARAKKYLVLANEHPTTLSRQVAGFMSVWDGRWAAAEREFDDAISRDPGDSWGYAYKAWALSLDGQYANAMAAIDEAMRREPHSPGYFYFLRGVAAFGLDRSDEAVVMLTTAAQLSPDDQWPQLFLAVTYMRLGRMREAWPAVLRFNTLSVQLDQPPISVSSIDRKFSGSQLGELLAHILVRAKLPSSPSLWLFEGSLRTLLLGHTIQGQRAEAGRGHQASFAADGTVTMSGDWGTETGGTSRIADRQVCIGWPSGRKGCAMVFRSIDGTREKENEYIWVSPDGAFPFSQVE